MSWAVTGPMPSIVSSCSSVAVPRLIGPSSAGRRGRRAARGPGRHDHLLAVGEPGGEVDRVGARRRAGAAGTLDGVGNAGAGRQPVDTRVAHLAGHVHHDVLSPTGRGREARPLFTRLSALGGEGDPAGLPGAIVGVAHPAGADQQHCDRNGRVDEELEAAEVGHGDSVPAPSPRSARWMRRLGADFELEGPRSAGDSEPGEPLGLLVEHVHALDSRPAGPLADEAD